MAAGLRASLVGVSHLCDYPDFVARLPKVTWSQLSDDSRSEQIDAQVRQQAHEGLFRLDMDALLQLAPDAIISQSLCDVCAVSDRLVQRVRHQLKNECDVITLAPHRLGEVLDSIIEVARLGGSETEQAALKTRGKLQARIDRVVERRERHLVDTTERPRILFLEWLDPPFLAGHWTPELIEMAGAHCVLARPHARSQQLTWPRIMNAKFDLVVISACGLSLGQTIEEVDRLTGGDHPLTQLIAAAPKGTWIVDGNHYFNRPGPRLVDALEWLSALVAEPSSTASHRINCVHIPSGSREIRADAVLHPPTA